MLGGNMMSGHAHARDLSYVSRLMREYNTDAKIRQMNWIAQVRLDGRGGFDQQISHDEKN
jgi:hypothetical protein